MRGKIIVIDGADGAGKATQVRLLVDRIKDEGYEVETLDFPRYQENKFGKLLRQCLDGECGDFMAVDPRIASVLYAADRFESREVISSWLSEGKVVVLDRYVSANMLHQGAKTSSDEELQDFLTWLDEVEHGTFCVPRPDIIVYLDVPFDYRQRLKQQAANEGKHGSRGSLDVAEADFEHQKATEEKSRNIIAAYNDWYSVSCITDGDLRSREDIHEEIFDLVHQKLN